MRTIFIILLLVACISCTNNESENNTCNTGVGADSVNLLCVDPACRLVFQPYNGFPEDELEAVSSKIEEYIRTNTGTVITDIVVLPNCELGSACMNKQKTRYRANSILDKQASFVSSPNDCIIGLLSEDISTSAHGYHDWGILGLSYLGKNNCVVSTYRILNKDTNLWKVVIHEFSHAFLGNPHCQNNDPTCIMQDCNGKANFSKKKDFCKKCKSML